MTKLGSLRDLKCEILAVLTNARTFLEFLNIDSKMYPKVGYMGYILKKNKKWGTKWGTKFQISRFSESVSDFGKNFKVYGFQRI